MLSVVCCAGVGVLSVWAWPRSKGSWDSSEFRQSITLPERFRPGIDCSMPAAVNNQSGNGLCAIEVTKAGKLKWSNRGGSQTSDSIFGQVVWAYPL